MGELVLIMVVALIVLGPKQLVETAKVAGRVYRELVKMAGEIRNSVDLDALTSDRGPHMPPTPPRQQPRPSPADTENVTMPPPGEKSGPDFYADLLESAREQVKEAEAEKAKQPEKTETQEKDRQPAETAKTT
jgi:Sec-independent protein translocase protein TatA